MAHEIKLEVAEKKSISTKHSIVCATRYGF